MSIKQHQPKLHRSDITTCRTYGAFLFAMISFYGYIAPLELISFRSAGFWKTDKTPFTFGGRAGDVGFNKQQTTNNKQQTTNNKQQT